MTNTIAKTIKIRCSDNYELTGTLFTPSGQIRAVAMIAPATGIKRKFYKSFSTYLAENGYAVITYDNRGIGDSLHGKIKDSNASLQQWGELDMPAVLDDLKNRFPGLKYHLIGHSAGGQLVGLMPNSIEITSIFNFACSSGRIKI